MVDKTIPMVVKIHKEAQGRLRTDEFAKRITHIFKPWASISRGAVNTWLAGTSEPNRFMLLYLRDIGDDREMADFARECLQVMGPRKE